MTDLQLKPSQHYQLATDSLGDKLRLLLAELPEGSVPLHRLLKLLGRDGLMLLVCLLSLVFLIPVSIPGVSTLFGLVILLIAINRLLGRPLWLPRRLRHKPVATHSLRQALDKALKAFSRLEKISRPHRLNWLTTTPGVHQVNNAALILGALLLMAPFGFIPFSNTLPALALILIAFVSIRSPQFFVRLENHRLASAYLEEEMETIASTNGTGFSGLETSVEKYLL